MLEDNSWDNQFYPESSTVIHKCKSMAIKKKKIFPVDSRVVQRVKGSSA